MAATAPTVVAVADALLIGLLTVKERASQTMYTKHGPAMAIVMMVRTFLQIMVAMNAQQALRFG